MFQAEISFYQILGLGQLDFTLYEKTFADRARPTKKCTLCASELHSTNICTYAPADQVAPSAPSPRPVVEICKLFNAQVGNKCHHMPCKYAYIRMKRLLRPASRISMYPLPLHASPSVGSGRWRFNRLFRCQDLT